MRAPRAAAPCRAEQAAISRATFVISVSSMALPGVAL